MQIAEQSKEREVTYYDFMFMTGNKLTITVDEEAGDQVEHHDHKYWFSIAAKPNTLDPEASVDAEEMHVHTRNLAFVAIRKRKHRLPSQEEMFDMRKTLQGLSKTIQ